MEIDYKKEFERIIDKKGSEKISIMGNAQGKSGNISVYEIAYENSRRKLKHRLVHPRTAMINVLKVLKAMENNGYVSTISIQRNIMCSKDMLDVVSFRIKKGII